VEHDEQAAQSTVPVVEGVQGLELVVRHGRGNDRIDLSVVPAGHPVQEVP